MRRSTDDVPEEFRPYLGKYRLVQVNADFTVFYRNGGLVVNDPMEKADIGIERTDKEGIWIDEFGKNKMSFDKDAEGKVTGAGDPLDQQVREGEVTGPVTPSIFRPRRRHVSSSYRMRARRSAPPR